MSMITMKAGSLQAVLIITKACLYCLSVHEHAPNMHWSDCLCTNNEVPMSMQDTKSRFDGITHAGTILNNQKSKPPTLNPAHQMAPKDVHNVRSEFQLDASPASSLVIFTNSCSSGCDHLFNRLVSQWLALNLLVQVVNVSPVVLAPVHLHGLLYKQCASMKCW